VNHKEAVEKAAHLTAGACAEVLGTLVGKPGSFSDVSVDEELSNPWDALAFPLVCVRIAFTEGITGEDMFVLAPDQARRLATAMMGMSESDAEGDLNDIELSAVSEAMNQMMGRVATAMAEAIGRSTDIATPQTDYLEAREAAEAVGEARFTARFTLHAGDLAATIVQLVPQDLADVLLAAFDSAAVMEAVLGAEHASKIARLNDDTYAAVERTARIAAESSAEVLGTLLGGRVTATLPEIDSQPADPLAELSYPLVTVEVSYVSGVNGANLFALTPAQSASLAAAMMGVDEPSGDGLSELELSAVSEAMNQMMGAATNILADTLSLDIEVAPPICEVIETVEQARATFEHPAYCARFRIVSDRLTADVVQLVPADFALHLQAAFAAADLGRSVTAEPHPQQAAAASSTAAANTAAAATPPGALGFDAFRSVKVRVSAELGRSRLAVARVMNLPPGAIVELDRTPDDPIDILVNGRPFARARLVLVDGEYAAQIVSLEPPLLKTA
jgi:flagellar motor switch protein FliN/FliY